jgi:hypothetical protein
MKSLLLGGALLLVSPEPRVDMQRFDAAVAVEASEAPRSPYEWRKLMKAVAIEESGLLQRIADGHCKPKECDRGRAKGLWQLHKNSINRELWAKQDGNIELQAHLASDQLERGYWTCHKTGVPWLVGTINGYAGRRCSDNWPGLQKRLATYGRL